PALTTSVTPSTLSFRIRSIPAFRVTVDAGQVTQAPESSTVTTPVASSTSISVRSPPSAWTAGRILVTTASTCSRTSSTLPVGLVASTAPWLRSIPMTVPPAPAALLAHAAHGNVLGAPELFLEAGLLVAVGLAVLALRSAWTAPHLAAAATGRLLAAWTAPLAAGAAAVAAVV